MLRKAALIVDGHELLFHAHRAAPAADVARDLVDVGNVDHGHALDARSPSPDQSLRGQRLARINGVLAQRLVRTLCAHCKESYVPDAQLLASTGLGRFCAPGQPIYRAVGCEHCRHTGYRGRTGIHELLVLDEPLRRAIIEGRDANSLHTLAAQSGMLNLFEDGLRKVAAGTTTLDELARVTQDHADA